MNSWIIIYIMKIVMNQDDSIHIQPLPTGEIISHE